MPEIRISFGIESTYFRWRWRVNRQETPEVIAADPHLPGRVSSFYDPTSPGYLYRSGRFLIHFRAPNPDTVEFLNIFWPRV